MGATGRSCIGEGVRLTAYHGWQQSHLVGRATVGLTLACFFLWCSAPGVDEPVRNLSKLAQHNDDVISQR